MFPDLFRQDVWDVDFDELGEHPGVILSVNRLNEKLSTVVVVLITGTSGPDTHVPLGPEAGLTRYPESYANVADIHAVDRLACLERRGRVSNEEMDHITRQLRVYLGC
ncbi:MAG TPA: type II toxin-antitoxin system PemK/MazF family toxin [Actinoplanes sp.]|nr:type II toxin-antitoxin system PemK/MazF family toxin [Actinoplanes sp.]